MDSDAVPSSPPASSSTTATAARAPRPPGPSGEMLDHDITYPLQPRSQYMSPAQFLSLESKRVIRQAQDPLYVNAPRVSHFLYEVTTSDRLQQHEWLCRCR